MRKALVVGINEYPGCELRGCVNDANSVAALLEYHESGAKNFDVDLEINIEKKAELIGKVKKLFSGNAEVALFYFSGHGYIDETGGFLVTPDYTKDDMGVGLATILKLANESKCKNRIIILDSCYSGEMGRSGFEGECSVIGDGVTVLTASLPEESAVEINGHGIFTNLFISALEGGAANVMGKITPGSIYSYIDQALGAWSQRPVFKTNISQFISVRDVKPRVALQTIKSIYKLFEEANAEYKLDPSYEFTNYEGAEYATVEPYARKENVEIFKVLQQLESIGLVEPVGEEHMYFAAMKSKACRLTALGQYYWKLISEKRI